MASIRFNKIKKDIKKYMVLAKLLKKDKCVPNISKMLLAMAIGYFFFPIDLIPDFIPILGHLDDFIIIPALIFLAIKFIPKRIYSKHYKMIFN